MMKFPRLHFLQIAVFAVLAILAVSLFHVQVLQGSYYRGLSTRNHIRLIPMEASRGRVFDRAGRLLATNRAAYDVVAFPEDVTPEVYPRLAKLLGMKEKEVRHQMSAGREYPFAPAVIKKDVAKSLAILIEERKPELPGVAIRVDGVRYYPYGETASHVIGYIGAINMAEYDRLDRDRFGINSMIGRAGIEKFFDDSLRGWRGGEQLEVDARGKVVQVLSRRPPEPGADLRLTLDLDFQKKIMDLIKGQHASVAVMDLETEGLLAMASSPAYDPNIFVSPSASGRRLSVLKDINSPMLDRSIGAAYPPGSVFKLVTALAALELGKITPQTRFYCNGKFKLGKSGRVAKCWFEGGHRSINLYEAIERSCNVYFYNLSTKLSPDDIAKYAHELGLGEPMRLEISRLTPGLIPDAAWKRSRFKQPWYQGETLNMAIGQGYVLVTPLEILRLTAIIAKNGKFVDPHLTQNDAAVGEPLRVAIREENLNVIKRAMLQVVESDYGTGQLARVDFDKLAAKTGTAQAPQKAHSWMTGFFPYKNPKIAFVVFVEHGGSGGITSARIVKQILEVWKGVDAPKAV
ncbi:MAG TPA: penicillin-binding protein 2 [Candidatus Omnitrophota bacterium]|jgi:penicillin-binding protein 2|nr:penicillin-binding protein 2 [Candidatus Omnitrophota bacterium]HQB94447.1 penicillin-binding protein 2 [Candidatus Omnitrophota bacterium]